MTIFDLDEMKNVRECQRMIRESQDKINKAIDHVRSSLTNDKEIKSLYDIYEQVELMKLTANTMAECMYWAVKDKEVTC